MRQSECRDDLENFPKCTREPGSRHPCAALANQDGWQEQRQQKQDVIEPPPDVPGSMPEVICELLECLGLTQLELLFGPIRRKNCGANPVAVRELKQAAML